MYKYCFVQIMKDKPTQSQRDGALCMIGSVAELLLQKEKEVYHEEIEIMLNTYISHKSNSEHDQVYMRARGCWVLQSFGDIKFKNKQTLSRILDFAIEKLLYDPNMPVKVEAAMIIQVYFTSQVRAPEYIKSKINKTKIDDLNSAMLKITQYLVELFSQLLEDEGDIDTKEKKGIGYLNTIETFLEIFKEKSEVAASIRLHAITVIKMIFKKNITCKYAVCTSTL